MLHVGVVTASSTAAERAFSDLNNSFGDKQKRAHEDYIETALMIHFRLRGEA